MAALCGFLLLAACAAAKGAGPGPATASAPDAAQAQLQSAWLRDPDLVLPYVRRAAGFWARSYDAERGGYYTVVARDGAPVSRDLKTTLTQSRHAYGLARAYMLTGDRAYLAQARRALAFLREKGWDAEHGGFHTALDGAGRSVDLGGGDLVLADQKWSFMQHYALLGIGAVYDAGRAPEDLALLTRARAVLDEKLWDARPGLEGYFETAAYDWSKPEGKGFTPTVDGITTHGEALVLLTRDPRYRARLLQLADAIVARLLPTARAHGLGFAEKYDADWREQPEGFFFVGHVLKSAWCLDRAYLVEPRPEYLAGAQELLKLARRTAWDEVHGGPFTTGNWLTGRIEGREKNWWTLEQAITAGLTAYHLTGDRQYLDMADEAADFFERHLVDPEYGEVFGETDPSGQTVRSANKGDYWKAGYHSIETAWYVYLYGNLFLSHRPVTLHYAIDPTPDARTLPLDPIALPGLRIAGVLRDGKPWTAFDAAARTLTVPAGVGGEFQVTFVAAPPPRRP